MTMPSDSRTARLMTIRSDGTALSAVTGEDGNAGMPSWSPDGSKIVSGRRWRDARPPHLRCRW